MASPAKTKMSAPRPVRPAGEPLASTSHPAFASAPGATWEIAPVDETHFDAAGSPAPPTSSRDEQISRFRGWRQRDPGSGYRSEVIAATTKVEGNEVRIVTVRAVPILPPRARCAQETNGGPDPGDHDRSRAGRSAGRHRQTPADARLSPVYSDGGARTRAASHIVPHDQFGMPIMQSLKRCACIWPMWLRPSPSVCSLPTIARHFCSSDWFSCLAWVFCAA